jgi:hypothetical protein
MLGAVAIVIVLLVLPIVICLSGAAVAAVLGWTLKADADARNQGSELVALNQ